MKKLFVLILLVLVLVACERPADVSTPKAPPPESDSGARFKAGARVPVDYEIYTISGVVTGDVSSLTRQTDAGGGQIRGSQFDSYGYVRGSWSGPEYSGKGFVRVHVTASDCLLARVGSVVILKTTDTKATALLVGDQVTFKCRVQYEAVAPLANNEVFEVERYETREIDYCRLERPVVLPAAADD